MANFRYLKLQLEMFFRDNILILLFIIICFIVGVLAGSIAANTLTYQQKEVLLDYLSGFITEVNQLLTDQQSLLAKQVIAANLKFGLLFWILGITMVGVIVIPFIIILRGFIMGFTATFLIREMFFKGVLLAVTSILPQNLLLIPGFILAGFLSFVFVFKLGAVMMSKRKYNLKSMLFQYSFSMLGITLVLFLAALIEVYIVPPLIRLVEGIII
ncbi:stage II sporulation protein M [Orenia marismortui]|uniref:stage II sporulation protein M n=1 Tax=Orenia marismortui TaxID=46469 RepID=UPI00037A0B66|nr:stage II sporulation protein M [Orenia marismortui]